MSNHHSPTFSICPVCTNKISEHSESMINKCFEALMGASSK